MKAWHISVCINHHSLRTISCCFKLYTVRRVMLVSDGPIIWLKTEILKVKYLLMMLIFKAYGMLSSEMIFSCRVNCFCTCLLGKLQGRQTMSGEKVCVVMLQVFFFLIIMNEIGRVSQRNLFLPPQIKEERKCYPNYEM